MKPPLFADLSFDDALVRSTADHKLLLVDATASWCQPCKVMARTTWVEASVTEAVRARGIALQIDVDAEKDVAQRLGIKAMPTVVAFRDGVEVDRVVGMQAPAAFVAWLEALSRGETSLDRARAAAAASPNDAKVYWQLAKKLVEVGLLEEATNEYVAAWTHMDGEAMIAVRNSFLASEVHELAMHHPPARVAFAAVRDRAKGGSPEWLSLNHTIEDDASTFAWFDSIKSRIASDPDLAAIIETYVIPRLTRAGRWADAGAAYRWPLEVWARIEKEWVAKELDEAPAEAVPPDQKAQVKMMIRAMAKSNLDELRRALREAHRDAELRTIDEAASKLDPELVK